MNNWKIKVILMIALFFVVFVHLNCAEFGAFSCRASKCIWYHQGGIIQKPWNSNSGFWRRLLKRIKPILYPSRDRRKISGASQWIRKVNETCGLALSAKYVLIEISINKQFGFLERKTRVWDGYALCRMCFSPSVTTNYACDAIAEVYKNESAPSKFSLCGDRERGKCNL